jgi:hypothetical protein
MTGSELHIGEWHFGRHGNVSDDLLNNPHFMLAMIGENVEALKYANKSLKTDRDFVLKAVSRCGSALKYADKSLRADRKVVLRALDKSFLWASEVWLSVDNSLRTDREVVLTAVKHDETALKHTNNALRSDREVVLTAVEHDGTALIYADISLRADREIVLAAVSSVCNDGLALEFADESLRADREVVLAAVNCNGWALEFADEALRADREVVLAAVRQCYSALKYAAQSLRADREVVLAAVYQDYSALAFADKSVLTDRAFMKLFNVIQKKYHSDIDITLDDHHLFDSLEKNKLISTAIMTIYPYKYKDLWVFDDPFVGLEKEPFVSGADDIIDMMVLPLKNADDGFKLLFSKTAFDGFQHSLTRLFYDDDGWWYLHKDSGMQGWLCPALFKYFNDAPEILYVAAFNEIAP